MAEKTKTSTAKKSTKTTAAKKAPAKKVAAKPAAKKAVTAKKAPAKAAAPKKAAAKPAAKKAAAKPVAKKAAVKPKATAKAAPKAAAKATKAPAKKAVAAKKPAAKKVTAAKPAAKKAGGASKVGETKSVVVRIQRSSKEADGTLKQWFDEFTIKYNHSTTILAALEDIKGNQDGSVTYRRSCRASICGSCGMVINNRSRLACKTKVKDIVDGVPEKNIPPSKIIELSPQKNQPVLKDLAVDIKPFYEKVNAVVPFVQDGGESESHVHKESFEQVNMVSNCIMCGSCYSDCTAMVENPDYLGPAALAKAFRFVSDPREGKKTARLKELSEKHGIWDCTRCGMCIDACPKDVAPMEAIVKLRTRALDKGILDNAGARHATAFKSDIKKFGVINEATLLVKTVGVLGMFGQVGNSLNMIKKGKIPSPYPIGHVKGLDEVRSIIKELDENPIDVETRAIDDGPGAG